MMAHPKPYYQSEYGAKYKVPEVTVPLPLEQKVAGLSSLSSKAVREPAFSQKRRVGSQRGIDDRVVQGMKFNEERMNLENQALRFKTGVRRPVEKWPTEYKLQYGWKATPPVPVVQAQQALGQHHDPGCPNKPVDQDWSVESVDGDSCDAADSDEDNHPEQKPTLTTTDRPPTAGAKKQRQPQQQNRKEGTQSAHTKPPRVSQNETTTRRPNRLTAPTKTKSRVQRVAPNKTAIKKAIEQADNSLSDSDTDSQTGQKIQSSTDSHHRCGHKRRKKKSVKRKLVWPMITEYQSQFKTKEVPTVAGDDDDDDDKPPAGSPQKLVDSSDPRLLKHSPMKLFKLQPESSKFTSEYLANYQSPTKLKYKEGAWSGVSPPHLLPQAWTTPTAADDADGDTNRSDWFDHVLELRRLAARYRRRAEETHFAQIHLADVEGEDGTEETASTLSSCSVCHRQKQQPPPTTPPPRSHDPNAPPTKSHNPKSYDPIVPVTKLPTRPLPTRSYDANAPPIGSHDPQDDTESNCTTPTSSAHQDTEPPTGQGLIHEEESDQDEPQGRLPTPELKQIPPARKIRHHLDRTTPCKGAILTSPPKEVRHGWNPEEDEEDEDPLTAPAIPPGVSKTLPRYRRDMSSCAPIYPSTTTTHHQQDRQPHVTTIKKSSGVVPNSRKTLTKRRDTHRTHAQVSSNKAPTTNTTTNRRIKNEDLECSFCGSMLRQQTCKGSRLVADNRPLAMHTLPASNMPHQPRKPHLPLSQQQPLSGSLLSLSSCSVASEVLQRAQHRKATFWNQRETTAT